ncbi:Metallopeptidase, catalytic domain [Balamuthia mandrillaris]
MNKDKRFFLLLPFLAVLFVLCGVVLLNREGSRPFPILSQRPVPQNAVVECVSWRNTAGCMAWGPPEPFLDKTCNETIPSDASGYCECHFVDQHNNAIAVPGNTTNDKRLPFLEFSCGHPPLTCNVVCATFLQEFIVSSSELVGKENDLEQHKIPRLIHQSWKSRKVPRATAPLQQQWLDLQANGWHYHFTTDEDNECLMKERFPWFEATWRSFERGGSSNVMAADSSRYMALFLFGGLYVDLDVHPFQPRFEQSMGAVFEQAQSQGNRRGEGDGGRSCSCVLGAEPHEHSLILNGAPRTVCNAVMMSVPGHPFWLQVLRTIQEGRRKLNLATDPVDITGPRMLEHALSEYRRLPISHEHPVCVTSPELFYPYFDETNSFAARCAPFLVQAQREDDIEASSIFPPTMYFEELANETAFLRRTEQDQDLYYDKLDMDKARTKLCQDLSANSFHNDRESRSKASIMAHLWVHYWLGMGDTTKTCEMTPALYSSSASAPSSPSSSSSFSPTSWSVSCSESAFSGTTCLTSQEGGLFCLQMEQLLRIALGCFFAILLCLFAVAACLAWGVCDSCILPRHHLPPQRHQSRG